MTLQEQLRTIRHDLFAHRNGVVADALRRAGDPHRVITGCQLADIRVIASQFTPDISLATALWADRNHREGRLMAIMLMPREQFRAELATQWLNDLMSTEEADVLAWRLLQHMPDADTLLETTSDNPVVNHCLNRLKGWLEP